MQRRRLRRAPPQCEKCDKYHQPTEDGECPTTAIHSCTIDELRKLQQDTIKAVQDHPTGGKTFEEKITRILNTLAKSAGNPPKSPRKVKNDKVDCFNWLRGNCGRTSCMFKHDPARKGSDPKAGRQKESSDDDSPKEKSKEAPNKAESDVNNSPDPTEIAAFAFSAHPFPDLLQTSYAIAREIGKECGCIVIVDDEEHREALKNYISPRVKQGEPVPTCV